MKAWLFCFIGFQLLSHAAEFQVMVDDEGIAHHRMEVETESPVRESVQKALLKRADIHSLNDSSGSLVQELDLAAVVLDKIVNLGKKVWTVIEHGRPVVNVRTAYANALPAGVRAQDLENLSELQFRSFRYFGENLYGVKVYDVTYTLAHRYGGQFNGQGAYIESATVLPQNVEVVWGYDVNLNVEEVSTVNLGTKEEPIASIAMETGLTIKTVLKELRMKNLHEFRGDRAEVHSTELQ